MSAYLVVNVSVTGSAEELAQYRDRVEDTVRPYGGQYLVRSSAPEVLEGQWDADQIVVVRFPDIESAKSWNDSGAYRAIAPLRIDNTNSLRLLADGLD